MSNVHHKVAFRCTHCGHFVTSASAGESDTPHSCSGCGRGVHFTTEPDKVIEKLEKKHKKGCGECRITRHQPLPGFHKLIEHDCWEVLVDATPERLAELGLDADDVEQHIPATKSGPARPPVMASVEASESPTAADKAS